MSGATTKNDPALASKICPIMRAETQCNECKAYDSGRCRIFDALDSLARIDVNLSDVDVDLADIGNNLTGIETQLDLMAARI